MKNNKWTVALAAAGLVSLPAVCLAEEKPNQVLTAIQGTTISGYVDTSAQWNFGTGNDNLPQYKFGGPDKADGFNLNVIQLRIEKPMDESEWAAGYRADLWFGPDANTLGTTSGESESGSDFAIRQAYVSLRVPVFGNGLDFKIGVFDNPNGYESVASPDNPNYTRSYGHGLEPQTLTGIAMSHRWADWFATTLGVANTTGPSINARAFNTPSDSDHNKAESYKTYFSQMEFTAPESMGFLAGSTLYWGVVNGFNDNENGSDIDENTTNYYLGLTANTPVKDLKVGFAFDYLKVHHSNDFAKALGLYTSYQCTPKLGLHFRAEYADSDVYYTYSGYSIDNAKIIDVTATIQYDLWANVLSRLELRWDHSANGQDIFGSGSEGEPDLKNAWMLAANIIYKF